MLREKEREGGERKEERQRGAKKKELHVQSK